MLGAIARKRAEFRRYGLLLALSALATLVNPYGWQLHRHVFGYLGSGWIVEHVGEFQSPQIRSENMQVFAVLLLLGAGVAAREWRRERWFECVLVFVWAFAALRSARYVPLFAVAAAPVIASSLAGWCAQWSSRTPARSALRVMSQSAEQLGLHWRITAWMPVLGAMAVWAVLPATGISDFPERSFPVEAVNHNSAFLESAAGRRVLTSDQWGDYLIYRFYPKLHVFYDGRSDFYGEPIGDDYRVLLEAGRRSREVMARYGFTAALLPLDWPLGQILEQDPGWRAVVPGRSGGAAGSKGGSS